MKIQVLGSGCTTCKRLHEMTEKAVEELKLSDKVEYLMGNEGMQKLIELGSVTSPVLVINGKIVMTGFTPDIEKIKSLIRKSSG